MVWGKRPQHQWTCFYEFRVIACFPPEDLQWRDSVWAAAMFSSGGGVGQEDRYSFAVLWSGSLLPVEGCLWPGGVPV